MKLKEGNIQFYLYNRNKLPHFKVTVAVKLHDVIFQGFDTWLGLCYEICGSHTGKQEALCLMGFDALFWQSYSGALNAPTAFPMLVDKVSVNNV